jgi:hypothetical protein
MQRYYYVREVEKILIGLYDMFDNLRVNKYLDPQRKVIDKTVKVPLVTHYSKDFASYLSSTTSKQILQVLPVAGLRYTGDARDDSNMTQPTYAREIYCRDQDFWIRDIQPRAYVFKFELTLLSGNTSDMWQLKENIQPYFQTYRTLRLKEFDFCPEIEREVPVCITGWSDEIRDETDLNANEAQVYQTTYQIEAHGVMHCPYMLPAEIRYAQMDFNVGKKLIDSEQILVYPDEIARQKRRLWETVSPSIRDGFSLLKSLTRTLVRRSTVEGEEYWSDETLRYAMLTYNEITGYDLNGDPTGFNPVTYNTDDGSGYIEQYVRNPDGSYATDDQGNYITEKVPAYSWEQVVVDDVERPAEVPSFDLLHLTFDEDSPFARDFSGLGRDFIAINDENRKFVPDIPPGNGSDAPEGYESTGLQLDSDSPDGVRPWSQILEWFGDNSEGKINSPYTFKATLQFKESTPGDTVFQYLYNPEDVTLEDGTVIPAGEVWFDWGVMDSRLYFTYKTTTQFRTFQTDTFEFDNKAIYSFYFVLYNSGESGAFGVKTNLNDTMIALSTYEVEE